MGIEFNISGLQNHVGLRPSSDTQWRNVASAKCFVGTDGKSVSSEVRVSLPDQKVLPAGRSAATELAAVCDKRDVDRRILPNPGLNQPDGLFRLSGHIG